MSQWLGTLQLVLPQRWLTTESRAAALQLVEVQHPCTATVHGTSTATTTAWKAHYQHQRRSALTMRHHPHMNDDDTHLQPTEARR